MPDTEYTRIFQLAQDRALHGFSSLAQRMMTEADESIMRGLAGSRPMADQKALTAARQLLRQESAGLVGRMDALFKSQMERAMRTMYTDLRPDLANLTADTLSLIDDETVDRQIEVDRLVIRIRDVDPETIGRLNVIVGQMHGEREARERENPFRPYLLARSLHDAVKDLYAREDAKKLLFEHLADALIKHLPAFYAGIRSAFESSGMRAQFVAQPSKLVRNQRYFGGISLGPAAAPEPISARAVSGMQHVFELLHHVSTNADTLQTLTGGQDAGGAGLHEFVRKVFASSSAVRFAPGAQQADAAPEADRFAPASGRLVARLTEYQSAAAAGKPGIDQLGPEQNQLFALREKLGAEQGSRLERVVINIVAMLFEFLLGDEKIPQALRGQIGRLQIPFLKAAILEPQLLQHAHHPARELLNRMSSAAIGCDVSAQPGKGIAEEIASIVDRILREFGNDAGIFADALARFEQFLERQLTGGDNVVAHCAVVLEEAERTGMLCANVSRSLGDLLPPLKVEPRVADFLMRIWARVLVRSYLQEQAGDANGAMHQKYRSLLPELIWSVQEKQTSQERSALVRLLPDLVRRLKSGFELIRLPEQECKEVLDRLVDMHTQVLRGGPPGRAHKLPSFDELRDRLSLLMIAPAGGSWTRGEPIEVPRFVIDAALAENDIAATLHPESEALFPAEEAAQFLSELKPGICMKLQGGSAILRLVWVSPQRSLYLFQSALGARPDIYTAGAMLQALLDGRLRPIEYAPVFERAVEALLAGADPAEAMQI